jgi:hypothetical protein
MDAGTGSEMSMPPTLADDVIFAILTGLLILVHAMGRSVASRDARMSYRVATFWIFISSMWFIGPITYFVFRKTHPLLAKRCIQQLLIACIALLLMALADRYLRSVPGAILPPAQSQYPSPH